jgi:hypothetical protein
MKLAFTWSNLTRSGLLLSLCAAVSIPLTAAAGCAGRASP